MIFERSKDPEAVLVGEGINGAISMSKDIVCA